MTSHRQTALDCATRIANTLLMQDKIESEGIAKKILTTANAFADWLGPDPVKPFGGQKPKPIFDKPCPVCKGEMFDLRENKKNPKGPDARCKAAKWDPNENKFTGCPGLIWPVATGEPSD